MIRRYPKDMVSPNVQHFQAGGGICPLDKPSIVFGL